MIMGTFLDGLDLTGVTLLPFTTYAVSGLGATARDYADPAPAAQMGPGLAVPGEEVAAGLDRSDHQLPPSPPRATGSPCSPAGRTASPPWPRNSATARSPSRPT